jgi:1,4-alpha-glucan branching enzyme
MHIFEIWAPLASRVAIKVNGSLLPMHGADEHGWWRLPVEDA